MRKIPKKNSFYQIKHVRRDYVVTRVYFHCRTVLLIHSSIKLDANAIKTIHDRPPIVCRTQYFSGEYDGLKRPNLLTLIPLTITHYSPKNILYLPKFLTVKLTIIITYSKIHFRSHRNRKL